MKNKEMRKKPTEDDHTKKDASSIKTD